MNNLKKKSRALHINKRTVDRIEHDRLLYQEESCATTIDLFLQILFYDDVTDLESENLLNLRKKVAVL